MTYRHVLCLPEDWCKNGLFDVFTVSFQLGLLSSLLPVFPYVEFWDMFLFEFTSKRLCLCIGISAHLWWWSVTPNALPCLPSVLGIWVPFSARWSVEDVIIIPTPLPYPVSSTSPLPSIANGVCFCLLVEKNRSPLRARAGPWLFKPNQVTPHRSPQWWSQCQWGWLPAGHVTQVRPSECLLRTLGRRLCSSFSKPALCPSFWKVWGHEAWGCCSRLAMIRETSPRMQLTSRERIGPCFHHRTTESKPVSTYVCQ